MAQTVKMNELFSPAGLASQVLSRTQVETVPFKIQCKTTIDCFNMAIYLYHGYIEIPARNGTTVNKVHDVGVCSGDGVSNQFRRGR